MSAPVMRDHPVAKTEEEQHLVVPVVGGQRPAMAEHDGLAGPPVLVKDIDAVFGLNGWHRFSFEKRITNVAH